MISAHRTSVTLLISAVLLVLITLATLGSNVAGAQGPVEVIAPVATATPAGPSDITSKPGDDRVTPERGDTLAIPATPTPCGDGHTRLIPKGECCGPVLGGCVSVCDKPGGCTGNGDCVLTAN